MLTCQVSEEKIMKKRILMIISLILAMLSLLTACNTAQSGGDVTEGSDTGAAETTPADPDPLLVNNINITDYTVVYDARASIGTEAAYKHFASKLKAAYKLEAPTSTSVTDTYQILIGVAGSNADIAAFYSNCTEGMIGFDGKSIYLLAKDNQGLYSVIDTFFSKIVEGEEYDTITITSNESVALTTESIKVMSYNVLYDLTDRDVNEVAEFIKSQNADVFGTQETMDEHKAAILATMTDYDCYTGVKLKGSNMQNMIFWNKTKFKAVSKGFQYLTDTPFVESKIPESNSYRGFSYVVLESLETHKQFMFVNVHITYRNAAGETNDDATRWKQAKYLKKFLEGSKYETMPIVLVGDFNSVPSSQTLTLMENTKRMDRAAWVAKQKGDLEGTIAVSERTKRDTKYAFDHIFVTSDRITVSYFTAVDKRNASGKYYSDHLPVVADIVIY